MKKIFSVFTVIVLITVSLISCGDAEVKNINTDTVVKEVLQTYKLTDGAVYTSSSETLGEYLDNDLIISYYGDATDYPDFSKVENYCVYLDDSDPRVITDVGIFKMNDTAYSETFMKYLQARIDAKIADGKAYPDIDVATLEKAVIRKKGSYVYYAVAGETEKIISDIESALGK